MSRITVTHNPRNKFENCLYVDGKLLLTGTSGLESVSLVPTNGKRSALQITVTDYQYYVENDECPEIHHYASVLSALGSREKVAALRPVCDLLRMSPNACDGCPKNPSK